MKRGFITWDRAELPPSVFEARLTRARKVLAERELPALIVYSDVFRSNQARFLTNFMPYWNRSLVVVPREQPPILLCALSPRVYPWIRSVTVLDDIRPAGKLVQSLLQLCTEREWKKIGVLDLPRLPHELHAPLLQSNVEVTDVSLGAMDDDELAMRRRAVTLARQILGDQLPKGAGMVDYRFVGGLEREFRRAGVEDLVILVSAGKAPAPAKGVTLGDQYSVSVALEYRGNWVKVTRARASETVCKILRDRFDSVLQENSGYVQNLSGPYPYEGCDRSDLAPESIYALHVEDSRLFYGDTCVGAAPL
jgi:hypothetical protein